MWSLYSTFAIGAVLSYLVLSYFHNRKSINVTNKHVVITGGSSGIGKSLAILLVQRGADVTIVARNIENLKNAMTDIRRNCISTKQKVTFLSVDVSDYDNFKTELEYVENLIGPVFGLINCAGFAVCGRLEDITIENVQEMVKTNILGTFYPTKIVIPKLKERKEGFLVITASQVALMGMYGYSVYSACKFALRGLAESIDMELKPYNISVTLALPPDTDTPGYHHENLSKPRETQLISESGGLYDPDVVAERILNDALVGKSHFPRDCIIYIFFVAEKKILQLHWRVKFPSYNTVCGNQSIFFNKGCSGAGSSVGTIQNNKFVVFTKFSSNNQRLCKKVTLICNSIHLYHNNH